MVRQVKAVKHPHTAGLLKQLELWKVYWSIVGDRRKLTRPNWEKKKEDILFVKGEVCKLLAICQGYVFYLFLHFVTIPDVLSNQFFIYFYGFLSK